MTDVQRNPEDELRIAIQQVSRGIRHNRGDQVSDSQLAVLIDLDLRGALTPSELAALEHVTPPSMNRTINALERAGLVTRSRSNDDARKVIVELTSAAVDLLAETRRLRTAWFSRRLAALTPAERETLLAAAPILRKLVTP
ncbi:MAG TPA: MarR family transcriptional regulator [Pseudolysinimonas sp.]|nr:MarR family transcriptional regulator [Pseudolysinimonas sp.]